MLHNVAVRWRKEHVKGTPEWSQLEVTAKLAPEHPSAWTLSGSPDAEILKVAEQDYRGELAGVHSGVLLCKQQDMGAWGSCAKNYARCMARSGLQSEVGSAGPSFKRLKIFSTVAPSHRPVTPQLDLRGWKQPSDWKKMSLQDNSESRRHSYSRGRDKIKAASKLPLINVQAECQSPSPSPPRYHPANLVAHPLYEET